MGYSKEKVSEKITALSAYEWGKLNSKELAKVFRAFETPRTGGKLTTKDEDALRAASIVIGAKESEAKSE